MLLVNSVTGLLKELIKLKKDFEAKPRTVVISEEIVELESEDGWKFSRGRISTVGLGKTTPWIVAISS